MDSKADDFVEVADLAKRIGMSAGFVYKQLREGVIPHLKFGNGPKSRVKIRKADAEKYVQSLNVEAAH